MAYLFSEAAGECLLSRPAAYKKQQCTREISSGIIIAIIISEEMGHRSKEGKSLHREIMTVKCLRGIYRHSTVKLRT